MISGGCLCGRVRYKTDAEPLFTSICHCRSCQRVSGSGYLPVMGVLKAVLDIAGETQIFTVTGGSGQPARRHFCANCGSTLFGTGDAFPTMIMIYCGSLDDPSQFKPQSRINTADRHAWETATEAMPTFPAMPTT